MSNPLDGARARGAGHQHAGRGGEPVEQVVERLAAAGIDVVRVAYPDLIGTERARDVLVERLPAVMEHGLAFCRAVYHTTPQGDVVPLPEGLGAGLPDIRVVPDLATLAPLPWEPGVAHCLGDAFEPHVTDPCPEGPREVLRRVVAALGETGLTAVAGPELEYFLCEPDPQSPTGWRRYGDAPGNVYVAGRKGDPDGHLLSTLRHLKDYGIGATMGNHEFCGGQFEINLDHSEAVDAADRAFRFKAAVKEIARTGGRLATFMAKPFNDEGGSGFHVHLSLCDQTGHNVLAGEQDEHGLSATARHAVAGVLAHAPALAALFNPTINSYKRFGPDTLAPWLIDWGLDNRSAMVRIPPERGAGTRLEVRLGDATANPYLGIAGLVAAAHLGIRDKLECPAPLEGYGYDAERSPLLPADLPSALDALDADTDLTTVLGEPFVRAFLTYKRDEVERFQRYVTDWEFREYAYHL
ncbi:glutamine synthetase family protein [Actinomadura rupiterrae]|uniref:glutamine synthetase family protein n=1 Tax=Actinomadura rupiterrae TaxID=559627 RepID=UPI0020A37209|nr:glutamine synthetase family protein [Actinomadura rupiterrae]MCP2341854.1 glutamine synthetase [Actinomadura rupiterrae]